MCVSSAWGVIKALGEGDITWAKRTGSRRALWTQGQAGAIALWSSCPGGAWGGPSRRSQAGGGESRRRGGLTEGGNDETGREVGLRINKGQEGLTTESFHRVGEGRGYSESGEGGVVLG